MWRDLRSPRATLRAVRDLVALDLRVLTGNRLAVLAGAEILWVLGLAIWQRFREDPWEGAAFYNTTIVFPSVVLAVALGMGAILGERDIRHLEMTFASPAGRYLAWAVRLGSLAVLGLGSCMGLSILTAVAVGHPLPIVRAGLHAAVPVLFVAAAAVFLSLVFNGAATAGLVVAGALAGSWTLLHGARIGKFDLFVNPFNPPPQVEPHAWFKVLVFNRCLLLVLTGLFVAGTMALLRRRERLI